MISVTYIGVFTYINRMWSFVVSIDYIEGILKE